MATISSQLFGRADEQSAEQEQLLKLFWNRAELKKEFDKLRADSMRLDEQVRKQQSVTLRLQQRFDQLEALLANPATAVRVNTYYQLRGVWRASQQRIVTLAEDLERTCRDREMREHVAAFRSRVNKSLSGVHREVARVSQLAETLAVQIRELREERTRRFGFWNFLTRKRLTAELRGRREELHIVTQRKQELEADIEARSAEEPPEFDGLSAEARRLINLRVIAYAQELYLLFARDDLANLAREAAAREVTDVRYGSHRDCRALSRTIEEANQALEGDSALLKRVQQRARYLGTVCNYRNDADTVPVAESLGGIVRLDGEGRKTGVAAPVNVLVDEYWEIFSVLLD
ncbi:MAG: hypothetical protein HKN56_01070 [Gammaproteobacteria bacterium]|nr:hypothetical protein [Gammaproteobacteria bacterium]NND53547.1 hypothetical protein [Gammaproteobacteria bacterium]